MVAVKKFFQKEHFDNEVEKLEQTKGSGFVPEILDKNEATLEVMMEYLDGGHIHDFLLFLQEDPGAVSFETRVEKAIEIVECVIFLHEQGIIHGDLNPKNILMDKHHIRVCDFALSGKRLGMRQYADPTYQLRPESDIFSLGLVLQELFGMKPVPCASVIYTSRPPLCQEGWGLSLSSSSSSSLFPSLVEEVVRGCAKEGGERLTGKELLESLLVVKEKLCSS